MLSRRNFLLTSSATLSVIGTSLKAQNLPGQSVLTDEQKSALKAANADPKLAPNLLLSEEDMDWWRDAKFGIFVHWGLYAIPAKGEWHMFNDNVPAAEYAKLANQFNPRHYNPEQWAQMAKAAGARYMVLTARHHDGFALFDSPTSYNHFDAIHSAAHQDLVAPFVNAVRNEGLRVGLYYSPLDWRFPAYFHPKEMPDNARAFKQQTYLQTEELMRNYGRIDILWWDGGWLAHKGTDADAAWFWQPDKLNRMVRRYQPKIVINPRSGWQGDYNVEEGPAPITGPIRPKPWEKAFSINKGAWGYTLDEAAYSSDQIVTHIINAVVRNGNVIANVGPDKDGIIPDAQQKALRGVGCWLAKYGRAIYGTRPGPLEPVDGYFGTTHSNQSVFLFVFKWPQDGLSLPASHLNIVRIRDFSGNEIDWDKGTDDIRIPPVGKMDDGPATVLEITLED